MSLVRSIATVGGWTMGSRVLGFVRDILIARYLGAGPVADAFFVAFKFPNFFRRLFAEGAFNASFVPQFAGVLATEGPAEARRYASATLAVLLTVLMPLTFLAQGAMPWLMVVVAPGFLAEPATYALAVELTRITFPYLLFMALVALLGGVLNSLEKFAAAAGAPIVLNIVLIGALLVLQAPLGAAHSLAWGVAAAGIAQFLLLAVAAERAGMGLSLPWPRLSPRVARTMRLMVPGAIGAGVVQINLVIDVMLASTLPAGAISYLYFADRVAQLPLGVVGVAVGIALLPLMSRQLKSGDDAAALDSQNRAIEFALLLTLPAATALVTVPQPIVQVLFARGAFGDADAAATGGALVGFALGLPAYVLIKALAPGFFAREDTATPVKVAVAALVVNVAAALALMPFLAHVGIALATALSAWLNALALGTLLVRRGRFAIDVRLRRRAVGMLLASAGMAAALWAAAGALVPWLAGGGTVAFLALAALVTVGLVVYGGLALIAGAVQPADFRRFLRRA
jgi:putative peptidoglycan lipid II flippase